MAQAERGIRVAGGLLVGLLLAGCASQVVPTVTPALPSASVGASGPAAAASGAAAEVPGGCGSTNVFSGPGPNAQGAGAIAGLAPLRWAAATPAAAAITAYFFRPPPELLDVEPSPSGPSNKVLWVTDGSLGPTLAIDAHPLGSASPIVPFSFPATGLDFPSEIDLPFAGCWELELGTTGAVIDVVAGPSGTAVPSGPPWWAVGGLTTCGRPAVARVRGELAYFGGCDANLGRPPNIILLSPGETFDLHMLIGDPDGSPLYPLPTSTDAKVVRLATAQDAATATYQAVGPGTATLMSNGICDDGGTASQTNGPCPVVLVSVASP